ncbi:hypothetical protein RF11_01918 [Thelohanellus kitauei]|uniref:MULE transposase domain-containing protein n=1 Tax=Thelohanellus kitauei TaxID=669202 RepID=A0A0C2MYG4_THEKT|nr:hypothetical protein RF11_01918 [Thelohanellus kitauei]
MTNKSEYLYFEILHQILVLLKNKWDPKIIVVDFENSLINSVKYIFKNSTILGCYFSFKQASFRKMKKMCIPDKECQKVWIQKYPPTLWNSNYINNGEILQKTNNCLERYNRRIGDQFLNAHPNIFNFVEVIKNKALYFTTLTSSIRSGRIKLNDSNLEF